MNAPTKKQSRAALILDLTKGYRWLLAISVIGTILAIFANFLTPQVFRFTVDSVLGEEPMPAFLQAWLADKGGHR